MRELSLVGRHQVVSPWTCSLHHQSSDDQVLLFPRSECTQDIGIVSVVAGEGSCNHVEVVPRGDHDLSALTLGCTDTRVCYEMALVQIDRKVGLSERNFARGGQGEMVMMFGNAWG
jgi:hypothetical protein